MCCPNASILRLSILRLNVQYTDKEDKKHTCLATPIWFAERPTPGAVLMAAIISLIIFSVSGVPISCFTKDDQ